jgi:phospholipid/cholesterol/gamma-HCH transport system substrate-binding protein
MINTETKVGLFSLAGVAVFGGVVLLLGDISFQSSYRAHALFSSADGLPVNGSVKVAGVEVGKVEKIQLENQRALVTLKMNKGVEVHRDARARVASTGLIGSKYLDMTLGSSDSPLLGEDGVIQGDETFSFDDVMSKLGEFFKEDPVNGSASDNLKVTLLNLRRVTDALNESMGNQKAALTEIVANIRDLSVHAKAVARNLDEISSEHKEDVKVALAKFRSVSERLDIILERVQNGNGILGKLVGDEDMGKDLKQTMTSVKEAAKDAQSVMGRIARVEVDWDYRQRYDPEDDRWRADVGMKFIPRPGKFYFLGGNNLGKRADRRDPGNDIERRNTISALMGREFGPATLFAGVIRSQGGAGFQFRPVPKKVSWSDRVELEGEAYDFGRDETVQGVRMKGTVYNAGVRLKLVRVPTVWLGAGVEDAAQRKNFVGNLHVSFKDEDIAYLLGLVGLAR